MKMKKTLAAVCAAALVVSMAATASLAVDYGMQMQIGSGPVNNNTSAPATSTTKEAAPATGLTYGAVKAAAASGETVEIDTAKCKLSTAAMSAIAKAKKPVSFVNDKGVTLTIDPKKVDDLGTIDLGMKITKKSSELKLDLKAEGELGLTLEITVPKDLIPADVDVEAAHVYATDKDGNTVDLGAVKLDKDGNIIIEITEGTDIVIK